VSCQKINPLIRLRHRLQGFWSWSDSQTWFKIFHLQMCFTLKLPFSAGIFQLMFDNDRYIKILS
jgi:hypothetical protein